MIEGLIEACPQDTVFAFTDGSCHGNPGPCGAGACVFFPGQTKHISLKQPVSKLAAILLGELFAKITKHIFTVIKIFSRSQSAVELLTLGWEVKTYKQTIADTKNLISYFTNKHIQVQIERTPGHANIHGNDIADRLAKEAANEAEVMT